MGSLFSQQKDKEFETVKTKYLNSINQLIRQHYDNSISQKRLRTNMSVCFESKYFDEINASEESQNQEYIYWLQYLYNYLSIDLRNREWAQEMIILLDEEQFLSENKYLSHFFYRDFYMSAEPTCIRQSKNDTSINNEIYEEASYELRTSINNSNLNMMRALGGSIGPNALTEDTNEINMSINEGTDTDSKYKTYRNRVKKYIEIFKEHIVYKDHPINKVIQIFEKAWVKYVDKHMIMMNNNQSEKEKERTNSLIDNIIRDFQNFIIRVQICLKLFYCRTINYACFTNEKDELMNLITTLFFKTGRIYKVTFDLQKIKLSNEVDDMINKYRQLYNITPQQLGIKKQFCLNEETLSLQESILEKEEKRIDENMKKDKEDKNRISDLNDKGVGVLYLNDDDPRDKKKIQDLLKKIKEMKKIFPKNFNYNSNNIKVDIDFDHDDNNLLPESYMNKPTYVSEDNSILPKGRENSCIETDFPMVNLQSRITCNPNIINTKEISNNIFCDNDINARELQNYDNENQIIRGCEEDGRKTVSPLKYIKIFNQVKFIKDPSNKTNIRYPYETAIQLLKQIEKYKAPFEKMLIFASLGNEITNCVNDFWKEMDDYVKNDMLGVEAEQLMTIFIFIIAKAQINDIVVHCKLIQLFTTSVIKSSMIGYYYSNAEASVTYIQNLKNINELIKGSIDIFNQNNNINNDQ